ncbi:MAG: hypothetical protein ABI643_01240 [Candidatus Doudnabacteria bacterium]
MEQETQQQPEQFNSPPENKKKIIIAIGVVVLVLLLASGYFLFSKRSVKQPETQQISQPVDITGQKMYRNQEYGFEFQYPQNFLVGKFKPEVTPSSNVPPDILEKQRDLSFNNAIVLVELEQKALFSKSPKNFSIDSIPIGEVPTISIKPITTSADFYRKNFIDSDTTWGGKNIKINEYQVTKLPGYPGPYGDAVYYYLLPISDNLIIEFIGFKQKILTNTTMTESYYDKIIENIISTFKLTQKVVEGRVITPYYLGFRV